MTLLRAVLLICLALLMTPRPSPAESVAVIDKPNIRITDPWLRQLFAAGMSTSPTLRSLVERLDGTDVVVYLQPDPHGSTGIAGRLTFLSTVAGTRYLVIRLTPLRSAVQQVAMIGHELQHAVEVADQPGIVDAESMYREYMRIGYPNGSTTSGVAVDTKAAIDVGDRITDELRDATLVVPPPLLP